MLVRRVRHGRNSSKFPLEISSLLRLDSYLVGVLALVISTVSDWKRFSWLGYYVTLLTIEKLGRKVIQFQGFLMAALFCESLLACLV